MDIEKNKMIQVKELEEVINQAKYELLDKYEYVSIGTMDIEKRENKIYYYLYVVIYKDKGLTEKILEGPLDKEFNSEDTIYQDIIEEINILRG